MQKGILFQGRHYFKRGRVLRFIWGADLINELLMGKAGCQDQKPVSRMPKIKNDSAAWALALRIDPNKLVRLMGHGSKKMVYEVYGDYIEGLEEDFWQILDYFGRDFIEPKRKGMPPGIAHYPHQTIPLPYPVHG